MANGFDWGAFLQQAGQGVGMIPGILEKQETLRRQRGMEDLMMKQRQQQMAAQQEQQRLEEESRTRTKQIQDLVAQGQAIPPELSVTPEAAKFQKQQAETQKSMLGIQESRSDLMKKHRQDILTSIGDTSLPQLQQYLQSNPGDYTGALKMATESGLQNIRGEHKSVDSFLNFIEDQQDREDSLKQAIEDAAKKGKSDDRNYIKDAFDANLRVSNAIDQSLNKDKNIKSFPEVTSNIKNINAAWETYKAGEPGAQAAMQQVIIMSFNKLLDPDSVVRESEFARIPLSQSFKAQLRAFFNRMKDTIDPEADPSGSRLTPELIEEFHHYANIIGKIRAQAYVMRLQGEAQSRKDEAGLYDINLNQKLDRYTNPLKTMPDLMNAIGYDLESNDILSYKPQKLEVIPFKSSLGSQIQNQTTSKSGTFSFED